MPDDPTPVEPTMSQLASRYEVLGTLGEGGMGQVLLVKDTATDREVALKLARPDAAAPREPTDRYRAKGLQQEFWTMTRLRHPRTVEVFDYGLLPDGTPYFTMEFVDGSAAEQLVPLAPEALADLLAKVCDALGYIHAQGFVHGDLKPANIRVTSAGDVKLMDYGLMERSGRNGGPIRGTPYYVAPEVVRGGPVDRRADLYSLGALAYHLLTGRPPFDGETAVEIFKKHLHELPHPPSGFVPCPPDLEEVVLKLLAKDPLERFQAATDVAAALGREAHAGRPSILAPSFVGREQEMHRLREVFNACMAASGAAAGAAGAAGQERPTVAGVLVSGEAGVGKSRLVSEFRVQIQLAEVPFASGVCHERSETPYGPWIQILRQLLPLARYHAALTLETHAPVLAALLPELGEPAPALEPREEALRLEGAISEVVYAVAEEAKALVLFLEDLHGQDPRSQELLGFLLRSAGGHPLLVLATARTGTPDKPYGEFLEPLPLSGLGAADLGLVVASSLGGAAVPESFLEAAHRITGGNPLFTEVLLRHLAETGSLRVEGHHWVVAADPVAEDLPAALRDLLREQQERLPPDARRLAGLAATAGRAVTLELLFDVWAGEPDAYFAALDCLRSEGILACDQGLCGFAHSAAREVLYASMPAEERRNGHGRLASALEATPGPADPDRALVLAEHYLGSDEPARAIPYCVPAGRRAAELYAGDQARHVLSGALALLDETPEAAEPSTRLELLSLLSDACRLAGDIEGALGAGTRAAALARELGDAAAEGRAETGTGRALQIRGDLEGAGRHLERARELLAGGSSPVLLCRSLASLGRIAYLGQDIGTAVAHYQSLLEVARGADLRPQTAEAVAFLGFAYVSADHERLEEGLDLLHESLEIRQGIGDCLGLLDTYMLLGNAYLALGHYPEARDCFAHCQHLAYVAGHKDEEVFSQLNLAVVGIEMGDFAVAEAMANLAEAGSEVTRSRYTGAMARVLRGTAALYAGKPGAACQDFAAAADRAVGLDHRYLDIILGAYQAEFLLMIGAASEGRDHARKAVELADAGGNREMLPSLLTVLGLLEVALGDRDEALSFLERARELAGSARSKGGMAKALRGLAMLEVAGRQYEAAKEHASEGLRLAEEVGADYLMGELNQLLGDACHGLGQNGQAINAYRAAQVIGDQKGAPDLLARAHIGLSQAEPTRAGHHMSSARERVVRLLEDLPEERRKSFASRWDRDLLAPPASGQRQEGPSLEFQLTRLQRGLNDFSMDFRKQQREWLDLQISHRRLQQLIDFSLTVNGIHDLREVQDKVIDLILSITGAERGFLLLFDTGVLRCQTYRNLYPEGRTALDYQISRSIAEDVLRTEQPLCLVDAMSDDRFKNYESIQALQLRTVICVPLKIRDQVVGVVYVDRQTINDEFSESDLDLVLSLAALAANAVENANLHGEWQDKGRKLAMLNDLSRTISTTLVMEEVLDLVVQMTLEVTKAERGFLLLWESERLACKAAMDKKGHRIGEQTVSMSICTAVLESGQPVSVTDAMSDQNLSLKQSIMLMSLRTVMAVPLIAKGTILGVLYVDSQAIVNTFTQRDLELLESIASHASVAIENAQLYQQLSRRAHELERTVQLYEEANMRAATDVLTGLYNRRYFQEELARDFAAARRHRRDLSVLMVDLDHFKSFNDTYGHHVGDAVLVAVAQVLQGAVRLADRVARYGGEEFIVNLPDTDVNGAKVVAERIRRGVTELKFEAGIRPITVSVGVASIQAQDDRIAELIERADQALFLAKSKGRNCIEVLEETEI